MERVSKRQYYLDIAAEVARRSTCLRRQYGAVIVKNDEIVATGYNGAPRGDENCCDVGVCWREAHGIPHGEQYEKCVAVHAECNAIISARGAVREVCGRPRRVQRHHLRQPQRDAGLHPLSLRLRKRQAHAEGGTLRHVRQDDQERRHLHGHQPDGGSVRLTLRVF